MKQMEKIYPPKLQDGVWTVEVETGVLLADLDYFLRHHDPPLAVSSNTVLDTIRYGGVISLGCHGAALAARTMPDVVTEVKIVDASGVLQTFSKEKDANEFSAATANLGLLGIIYSYTMIVEPMFKLLMSQSHPPVSDYFGDPEICGPKLKAMAVTNDQTEIFFWPFNSPGLTRDGDTLWLKQWQRTNRTVTENSLARGVRSVFANLETEFGNTLFQYMAANPSSTPFIDYLLYSLNKGDSERVLYAPEAIHYQPGIDNIPCLSTEMAFQVDEDFQNVVKAGNYVIDKVYELAHQGKFPVNIALEMRFVKSSSMIMSNAYNENPEAIYCMMEIVSVVGTPGFEEFSAMVAQYWMENFQAMQTSKFKPEMTLISPKNVNIVLVHGALADGSSWSKVIPILQAAGHSVTAVQQPLNSIDNDVAQTKSVLARTPGPIVLVGHSFGGLVITEAGHNAPNVSALVYVAGFANDKGESVTDIGKNFTPLPSASAFDTDSMGRLVLSQDKFIKYFCPDVAKKEAKIMAAVQGPMDAPRFGYAAGSPAWKEHPSYYIVAENDQIIEPKMQTFFAKRMKAKKTITVPGASHAVMVSHPKKVAALILEAAKAVAESH
ncbi:hypothetical protein BGZ72_000170 [Mortierella alpina]|nr:hypothetical protein BGZ72_000170 [Mortierella alpina]